MDDFQQLQELAAAYNALSQPQQGWLLTFALAVITALAANAAAARCCRPRHQSAITEPQPSTTEASPLPVDAVCHTATVESGSSASTIITESDSAGAALSAADLAPSHDHESDQQPLASKGQLPLQCDCFLKASYFVSDLPVTYSGDDELFLREYPSFAQRPEAELQTVFRQLHEEYQRRKHLDRDAATRRQQLQTKYSPIDASVRRLDPDTDLDPSFLRLVAEARKALNGDVQAAAQVRRSINKLGDCNEPVDLQAGPRSKRRGRNSIFALPVFSSSFCERFAKECSHIRLSVPPELLSRPNSMNNYGLKLDELGFTPHFTDPLLTDYIRPLSQVLYSDSAYGSLDNHTAFTVHYQEQKDKSLALHFDASDITLNVNIFKANAKGGRLVFRGARATPGSETIWDHQPGWGVLHLGHEWHEAQPLTAGERMNLVIWCKSSALFKEQGCYMCARPQRRIQEEEEAAEQQDDEDNGRSPPFSPNDSASIPASPLSSPLRVYNGSQVHISKLDYRGSQKKANNH